MLKKKILDYDKIIDLTLKNQEFIKIKKAKNMIFNLIKVNGLFMLEDPKTKDRIHISHPDLLITLV